MVFVKQNLNKNLFDLPHCEIKISWGGIRHTGVLPPSSLLFTRDSRNCCSAS